MYSSSGKSGRLSPPPPPVSEGQYPAPGEMSPEPDEEYILMKVIVYDRGSQSINLKISRKNITRDVTKSVSTKLKLSREEGKLHSLVMVISTTDLKHCIRTLKPDESILDAFDAILKKMGEKYQIADPTKLRSSVRWFYKDMRTPPLDLGDSGVTVGEYDSDDEENLSESDCFYFSKVEKKGYMLKRSNKDTNVWKRWYCVLADHLWCIDFNREPYKVICIRLHSLIRTREGNSFSDQIQNIIVNSLKGSHYFRAFSIMDQRSWIDHLQAWTTYVVENESMTMAEVIMNDEEESKSRRFRKQMGRVLDSETVYDAICIDRRRPAVSSSNKKPLDIEDELESIEDFFIQEKNNQDPINEMMVDISTNADLESADSTPPTIQIPSKEDVNERNNDNGESRNASPQKASYQTSSALPAMASSPISSNSYATLHPLDRTVTQSIIHRLHQHEFLLSYLMGFLLDVLQYKELFRHDLFCSVQSQRNAAFHIFIKYFHKQARRAGIPLHHDKLREIADEQAELASTRLKEAISNQFSYVRPRDAYIASPGILAGSSSAGTGGDYPTATVLTAGNSGGSGSFNSAAMRSPSSNVQRQRDQSLLVQRLRSTSTSNAPKELASPDLTGNNLLTPTKRLSDSLLDLQTEISEDNWQLSSARFEKMIQMLFGNLIRVQIESEDDSPDALDNPDYIASQHALNPTRTSTYLSPDDIKSLASSRKATLGNSGANSPNPTGRTSPLRNASTRNPTATSNTTTSSSSGFFFGLFGGGSSNTAAANSSSNNTASSSNTLHKSVPASAAAVGGGAMFLSRRFARNTANTSAKSNTNGGPNASILQALEEEERIMVMSQIVASAEVFDEVVNDIIELLHR